MLAISCLLMAAMHPHLSSAFQARIKRKTKWQEIFSNGLLPVFSGVKIFPDLCTLIGQKYIIWPSIAVKGESEALRKKMLASQTLLRS